ncbi:glycosyltransferase family 52 [Salinisphaera hydrothermalis]|uniref:glycosyltransferase family 52 n=1 Tax=Salinisphaera hydrothermalis TaxID=563188 RepID=UPI003341F991
MGENIDRSTNLFICFTPLQMSIARALIVAESEFDDANEVLVVPLSESKKYRYYFDLVAQDCTRSWYSPIRAHLPLYVFRLLRLFNNRKYNCVYLASIDSYYAHYVLSYCSFNKLRTFDDGAANITDLSKFYAAESGLRVLKSWLHRFVGKNLVKKNSLLGRKTLHSIPTVSEY